MAYQNNPQLLERASGGDSAALDTLVEENLGLVHACARRFAGRGVEYDDLFQAGSMGLVKAVAGFDISRGVQFSTYAVPVILGEIRRLFRDDGPVKVSRSLRELSLKAARARDQLRGSLGREPTIGELAAVLGLDPAEAAEAIEAGAPPLSLTFSDEDTDSQADIPVGSGEENLCARLSLEEALSSLDDRDRILITLRYYRNKTQSETARVLRMTQVQVSRREKKILSQLAGVLGSG